MEPARISNEAAADFVSELTDDYGLYTPDGLSEASIDQLIDEVDRGIANDERAADRRVERRFNDVPRVHRARRRAEREHLARLQTYMPAGEVAA